jgi:hypothetical protein
MIIFKEIHLFAWGSIAANATGELTSAHTGAETSDSVVASPTTALPAGVAFAGARVSASGFITVRIANVTGGLIAVGNVNFAVTTMRL